MRHTVEKSFLQVITDKLVHIFLVQSMEHPSSSGEFKESATVQDADSKINKVIQRLWNTHNYESEKATNGKTPFVF